MMILKAVAIVLCSFMLGICCAKYSECRNWEKVLYSLEAENEDYYFAKGVLWAFHMVIEKKDTRHEPET